MFSSCSRSSTPSRKVPPPIGSSSSPGRQSGGGCPARAQQTFLSRVLERAQPLGDPGDGERGDQEEEAANRDREGEFRHRVEDVGDCEQRQAGDRRRQRGPGPEPPGGETDRDAEEEDEAGGIRAGSDEDGEDDENRGGDRSDAGGSRESPWQLGPTIQQPYIRGPTAAR